MLTEFQLRMICTIVTFGLIVCAMMPGEVIDGQWELRIISSQRTVCPDAPNGEPRGRLPNGPGLSAANGP